MTNVTGQLATQTVAAVQKQVGEVAQALDTELAQGRETINIALRWFTENGLSFLVNVCVALLLLCAGMSAIRLLTRATGKALAKTGHVNVLLQHFLCSVVNKTAWVLLIMIVLQRLGVDIAPLIAGLGITGFIWVSRFRNR